MESLVRRMESRYWEVFHTRGEVVVVRWGGRRNACAVTVCSEELVPAIAEPIDSVRIPSKGSHLPSRVWSIDLCGQLVDS